jgi:tetratricopeptide (TPR) repeat protein
MIAALPLDPRLLHLGRSRRSFVVENAPFVALCALTAVVVAVGPAVRIFGPALHTFESPESGLAVAYPTLWSVGENHLGYPSWGNNLGATLGLRAERFRSTQNARLDEVRQRFLGELRKRETDGDITSVAILDERPAAIEGGRAIELRISLESRAGPQVTRNILIERGYYSYAISVSSPLAYAKSYEVIFDRLIASIRLIEPASLVKARTLVTTFPGMSSAHVELGRELASIGSVKAAAQSYQRALQALPEQADALYGLAKLAADYEGDLAGAEKIAGSLHDLNPKEPSYAALLADLRLRLGQLDAACGVLQETLDRNSTEPPEELRERLRSLKCGSSAFLER